jgi:hypothetical protein
MYEITGANAKRVKDKKSGFALLEIGQERKSPKSKKP